MECRICLKSDELCQNFCNCKGTIQWIHRECLIRWIITSKNTSCEICKCPFNLKVDVDLIYDTEYDMYDQNQLSISFFTSVFSIFAFYTLHYFFYYYMICFVYIGVFFLTNFHNNVT